MFNLWEWGHCFAWQGYSSLWVGYKFTGHEFKCKSGVYRIYLAHGGFWLNNKRISKRNWREICVLDSKNLWGSGPLLSHGRVTRPICINFVNFIWSLFIYLLNCGEIKVSSLSSCVQIPDWHTINTCFNIIWKGLHYKLKSFPIWTQLESQFNIGFYHRSINKNRHFK